jgi:redox-sensitive bicupin YhaK (pirin superfamily)
VQFIKIDYPVIILFLNCADMKLKRPALARGYADHGWLKSFHSFSFADYHDPEFMGFGPLRVINEDWIASGKGFGTHGHKDMEIITYVLEGELAHKDNMGNGRAIYPHEVQRMSAGRGVMHSEYNHAKDQTTHLLQIWIQPDLLGVEPSYEQTMFAPEEKRGKLRLVASPDGKDQSVTIHSNTRLFAGLIDGAEVVEHALEKNRIAYVYVARGQVIVNDEALEAGDALMIAEEDLINIGQGVDAEILLFDLPIAALPRLASSN